MKILIEESVLRQALECIEFLGGAKMSATYRVKESITALRTALDAAEKVEPVAYTDGDGNFCMALPECCGCTIPLYAHPVPAEGWQLAPKEPTDEMFDAWVKRLEEGESWWACYKAMLSAAPKPGGLRGGG